MSKNAFDFIVSKARILLGEAGNDPIKKASLVKEIVSSIALIPEAISRSVYIKECSSLLDIEEKVLINELNKIRRIRLNQQERNKSRLIDEERNEGEESAVEFKEIPEKLYDDVSVQERDILRIILSYADKTIRILADDGNELEVEVAPFMVHELIRDEMLFEDETCLKVLNLIIEYVDGENPILMGDFINNEDNEISKLAVDLLSSKYDLHEWWGERKILVEGEELKLKRAVEGSLYSYKSKRISKMIHENQEKLKEIDAEEKEEEVFEILRTQQMLDKIKASLSKPSGRIILS